MNSTPASAGFGKHFVVDGEYIWKYTHNAYDFSVFGTTPITFPIEWHNSKIPGFTVRANVPNSTASRPTWSCPASRRVSSRRSRRGRRCSVRHPGVFRIDHDERYNQTTHLQYQP